MGGSAFSTGPAPLLTPRMPPAIYAAVKQRCTASLDELYHHVDTPLEGPDKSDHGDVDVVVASPRDPSAAAAAPVAIAAALGAVRSVVYEKAPSSFALPWPAHAQGPEERFVQVDVRVCAHVEAWNWLRFRLAHGDAWNILGAVLRPVGLVVDDDALCLRVADIEPHDGPRSKVPLTNDPDRVLAFLALPVAPWHAGVFASADALFEYLAQCRFFTTAAPSTPVVENAARRRRLAHRPLYRRWAADFVPACRAAGRFAAPPPDRAAVAADALAAFPDAAPVFAARRDAFLVERQAVELRHGLLAPAVAAAAVPARWAASPSVETTYRACLAKALRAVVLDADASYGVVPAEPLRPDDDGFWDRARVEAFVAGALDELGAAAMERHQRGFVEHCRRREAEAARAKDAAKDGVAEAKDQEKGGE